VVGNVLFEYSSNEDMMESIDIEEKDEDDDEDDNEHGDEFGDEDDDALSFEILTYAFPLGCQSII